ncbi:MAG TPA: phospholipase D-like domain-containing protein [Isosphaeraceae bacterium]|nr:phospholipase D-like domain-containing protein [Isosphaeraceae bacterium]
MADERELLRESAQRILSSDKRLADQVDLLRGLASQDELRATLNNVRDRVGALESVGPDSALALETIVNRVGRPVLEVADDDYEIEGAEAAIWEPRLSIPTVRAAIRSVIPSVGRIEVDNNPDFTWLGTGWLIGDDVVVTNRHVASEFAALSVTAAGRSFVFKRGWPDRNTRMAARVDFRRELRNNSPRAFSVREVLHIEDDDGPDFAFLQVESPGSSGPLSPKLHPSDKPAEAAEYVATIGYPAADSRIPEQELMSRLFGDKYNVKRLSPGQILRLDHDLVMHDCSTLGGNSGSPIVDLATGDVLGLHFSGVFLRENRGVPIGYVTSRLQKVLSPGRPTPEQRVGDVTRVPATDRPAAPSFSPATIEAAGASATWIIPLQVSVTLGAPVLGTVAVAATSITAVPVTAAPTPPASISPAPASVEAAVSQARSVVEGRDTVLTVRDGYAFRNGWITPDPAVVVVLKGAGRATAQDLGLPTRLGAFPVEVRPASPWDLAEAQERLESLEGVPTTAYVKPKDLSLDEIHEKMTVICHVSPDAGWPTLSDFLAGTKVGLTIGMYDFTAHHIIEGVLGAVQAEPRELTLVMQEGEALSGKPDDVKEEVTIDQYREALGDRFDYAPASIGKGHQFATAYHIKVAVRDSKAFWLSSGNWQTSNQPDHGIAVGETSWDLLLGHNREWNIMIENANLARQFEKYIQYDLKNAKADAAPEALVAEGPFFLVDEAVEERAPIGKPTYFAPLKVNRKVQVRPLLTPDNYQEHVLDLINTAERRILFQNQSLSLLAGDKNDDRFAALVDALLDKQKAGVDLRIIIRGEFAPVGPLEQMQKRGFDMGKVRLQNRCHTKGIIVDGVRVLIGSHNWTNQGTLVNRDASLIFEDEEIAGYYEEIFWFDWKHLTRQSIGGRRVRPAGGDEEAPSGMRRVSWQEIEYG